MPDATLTVVPDEADTATVTVTFTKERETKNFVRFAENVEAGSTAVIGTLYVAAAVAGAATEVTAELTLS